MTISHRSMRTGTLSPAKPANVAIGDLDGDGRPDVVVTTEGTNVLVFLNRPVVTLFAGTTATGTGTATARISGGGPTCGFDLASTGFRLTPAIPAPPSGATFPQGMFTFRADGCIPGSSIVVDVTWPSLDRATRYLKLTSTNASARPVWYEPIGYSVDGTTTHFTVIDGGVGDDDLSLNGVIVDPGGPALFAVAVVTEIPATGRTAVALICLALLVSGALALRQRVPR